MAGAGLPTASGFSRRSLRRLLLLASLLLVAGAVADVNSTSLSPLGWRGEANPVVREIWRDHGFAAICAMKGVLLGIALLAGLGAYALDGATAALAEFPAAYRRLAILVAGLGVRMLTSVLLAGAASWFAFAGRNYLLAWDLILAGLSLVGAAASTVALALGVVAPHRLR